MDKYRRRNAQEIMMRNPKSCCEEKTKSDKKGFLSGILYGLLPHTFCIAFIIFTVLGTATLTSLLKPLLLNPYFFYFLIALSFIFATISAIIYLKTTTHPSLSQTTSGPLNGILTLEGMKRKWKYLLILYGTTISVNLILFMIIFPIVVNLNADSSFTAAVLGAFGEKSQTENSQSFLTLEVEIPCPGHAPIITEELKEIKGVESVKFRFPNLFDVSYDSGKTSKEQILSLEVFNIYKATVLK